MRKYLLLVLAILLIFSQVDARDGGGRGGRGGGGGRSPSMSRSYSRGGGQRAHQPDRPMRVDGGQRDRQNRRQPDRVTTPRGEQLQGRRDGQNVPDRAYTPRGEQLQGHGEDLRAKVNERQEAGKRQERVDNRQESGPLRHEVLGHHQELRKEHGGDIRKNISDRHSNHNQWFDNHFWDRHNHHPHYPWRGNYWGPLGWGTLGAWLPWTVGGAYYYYDGGDVYYSQPTGGVSQMETAPFDYNQSDEALSDLPASSSNEADWLPLGIYALTGAKNTSSSPNMYLQLALDKQGNIQGTLYNSTSDELFPISGYVDKEQRVLLQVTGKEDAPILETGLYNLTEEQSTVQMHFANGQTQDWLLVRLQNN